MKLVLTLLVRNEADVVDANLAFHLNACVDFVIATDNGSEDGTTDILEAYARQGHLHLITEPGRDMRQGERVTRMARLAATEFAADWVIHGDADEFYWPRALDLKEALAPIPERFGTVRTFVRTFLLRPHDDDFFADRMNVRLSVLAPINDPSSIFRPGAKIIHRADPHISLGDGTHTFHGAGLTPLRGWYPIELLHFPFRTRAQTERKFVNGWQAWSRNPNREPSHYISTAFSAIDDGRVGEFVDSLTITDEDLDRGLEDGSLVVDNRLREALRTLHGGVQASQFRILPGGSGLRIAAPDLLEETRYAVEAAVLEEADVARMQRRIDELEARIAALEAGPATRARHTLASALRR